MKIAAALFAIFLLNAFSDDLFAQEIGDVFLSPAGEPVQVRSSFVARTLRTGETETRVGGSDGQDYDSKTGWKFEPAAGTNSPDFLATETVASRRDQPAVVTIQKIMKIIKGADGKVLAYVLAEERSDIGKMIKVNEVRASKGQIIAHDDLPRFIRQVPAFKLVEMTRGTAHAELGDLSAGKDKLLLQIYDSAQSRRNYTISYMGKNLAVELYNRAKQLKTAPAEILGRMLENAPAVQKLIGAKTSPQEISREAVRSAEGAR